MNKLKRFSATAIALPLTAAVALSSTGVAVAADKETPSSSASETPSASGETTLNIAVDGLDDGTEVKLVTAEGDEVDSQEVEDSKVAFTYDKGDEANQVLSIKVDGKIYETIGGQCAGVINSTPATDSNGGLITGDDTDGIDITELPGGDNIPSTPGDSETPSGSENPTSSPSLPGGDDLTPSLPGDDTTPSDSESPSASDSESPSASDSESPSASDSEKPSASGSKTPTSGSEKPGATSGSETPSESEKPKNDGSNTPAGDEKPSATSTADADKPGADKPGADKPGDTGAQARSAVSLQADNGVNFTVDSSGNIYLENNQDRLGIDDLTLASQSDRFDINTILGAVGGVEGIANIASSVLPEILGEGGGEVGKFLSDAKNSEIVKGADNIVKFLAPIAKVLHPLAKNPAIAAMAGPILTSKTGLPWEVVVKVLELLASGQGVSGAINMVENFLSGKGLVMDDPNASTDGTTPGGATTPGDDLIGGVDGGTDGSGDLGGDTGTDTTPGEGDDVTTPNPDGDDPILVPGDAVAPILDEVVNQIEAKTKSADINLEVDEASFTIDPANEADLITCDFEFQEAKDKDDDKEKPSETKSSDNSKSNKTPSVPSLANSPAQAANPAASYGPKVDTGGSVVEENFFAKVSHRIASFF